MYPTGAQYCKHVDDFVIWIVSGKDEQRLPTLDSMLGNESKALEMLRVAPSIEYFIDLIAVLLLSNFIGRNTGRGHL
jgi:hypothetical protein